MKYIEVEKLIAEIERQQRKLIILSNTEQVDMRRDCALQNGVYNNVLGIIDSLQQEQQEVDLEKAIDDYYHENLGFIIGPNDTKKIVEDIARRFYELGLNARKEE